MGLRSINRPVSYVGNYEKLKEKKHKASRCMEIEPITDLNSLESEPLNQ